MVLQLNYTNLVFTRLDTTAKMLFNSFTYNVTLFFGIYEKSPIYMEELTLSYSREFATSPQKYDVIANAILNMLQKAGMQCIVIFVRI